MTAENNIDNVLIHINSGSKYFEKCCWTGQQGFVIRRYFLFLPESTSLSYSHGMFFFFVDRSKGNECSPSPTRMTEPL
ncbi:uncharacterized protein MELLADRAFT_85956 [Melampsora larici-populina 98AG31]|uniref:Uncharacterized protein n=1 Tax=Melampsora larici-populina (strain 98AG31 / pathotype 3-4-7) TaxID=747676 RepID=F4RKA0_MELLP|nr:uncharacterized protein MELLADRAFT_85956 [Melampsora larici-populina 98AG31]EGG07058.1 hypothetical protein MELLADRAFT_85956 [Melampsora larici-populina 98AG31]